MANKINQVLRQWPKGTVTTQGWLTAQGVSAQLTHRYKHSGWIERVGQGAYIRAGEQVDWKGMVYGLQQHTNLDIWPGGRTALAMTGYAHYLPMGRETIWLFGSPGTRLPAWVGQHDWGARIEYRAPKLFDPAAGAQLDVSHGQFDGLLLKVSSMERASLEMLYGVHDESAFVQAGEVFQGLVNLRPKVMQLCLQACGSVRVTRLALFLGAHYGHTWFEKLDRTKVNLGAGKRQIVQGGVLNDRFQITVPREFADGS